jgi:hypothetical protein
MWGADSDQVGAAREAFEESRLPLLVDLHRWEELPAEFRTEIEAASVVLQDARSDDATSGPA